MPACFLSSIFHRTGEFPMRLCLNKIRLNSAEWLTAFWGSLCFGFFKAAGICQIGFVGWMVIENWQGV